MANYGQVQRSNKPANDKNKPTVSFNVNQKPQNSIPSVLENHRTLLVEIIVQTLNRIDDLRNNETYHKHYNFAVKFLIKEEQQLIENYEQTNDDGEEEDDENQPNTITYTETKRTNYRDEYTGR